MGECEEIKGSDRIAILSDFDAQNGRRLMFRKEEDRKKWSLFCLKITRYERKSSPDIDK